MKSFIAILKNDRGISPVESLVAIGLFGAVALVGLKQSEFMGKKSNSLRLERELTDFQSGFERLVNDPETCEKNFVGKTVPMTLDRLLDENGNPLFSTKAIVSEETHNESQGGAIEENQKSQEPGSKEHYPNHSDARPVKTLTREQPTYLNGKIKINHLALQFNEENVQLKIDYEKLAGDSFTKFSKAINLMVDLDENNKIVSCFSLETSLDETIQYLVAKKLCERTYGEGTAAFNAHFQAGAQGADASCSFDGIPTGLNTPCSPGEAITSIQYSPSSKSFLPSCSSPINSNICPSGWMRSIDKYGNTQCNDLGNHIDMTAIVVNAPTKCRLMSSSSSNKLRLECDDSSAPKP